MLLALAPPWVQHQQLLIQALNNNCNNNNNHTLRYHCNPQHTEKLLPLVFLLLVLLARDVLLLLSLAVWPWPPLARSPNLEKPATSVPFPPIS